MLCAEILANAIRADKTINGINIYNREIKLSQYTDDTTVFVADLSSAQNLFSLLDAFQKCSGLKVNKSKTEGMWLGANKNNEEQPLGIQWPKDSICALGIPFSYNEEIGLKKKLRKQTFFRDYFVKFMVPKKSHFARSYYHIENSGPLKAYL